MGRPLVAHALPHWIEPEAVYLACHAGEDPSFWLDAGPDAVDGWSWVGTGLREPDARTVRDRMLGGPTSAADSGPFQGGWVGWFGYEGGARAGGAPVAHEQAAIAEEALIRTTRFVAFDHGARRAWAFAEASAIDSYVRDVLAAPEPQAVDAAADRGEASGRHSPDAYATLIERCRDAIREGDAYQLCLTTRFSVAGEVDPVAAFRRLRRATGAHHGGLIVSDAVALVSASPERFLAVGGDRVSTSPIKGTRPRGADGERDAALAAELRASPKERAENVMIVDLMRNDLSRVCEPGTVGVDALLEVESYPAVHQLVSTVSGRLRAQTTLGMLLEAAFPAGSMTGAPKLSAMTLLHGLEGGPRGVYSGAFGWIGDDGALDLAMVIRSVVVHEGGAYVGAGGGITWGSIAREEVAEVGVKARGPLAAVGARLPEGW